MIGVSDCAYREKCPDKWTKAVKVYYHENYISDEREDIAILELGENIPKAKAIPICLPKENEEIYHNLKAIGAGATGPNGTLNPPDGQQIVDVTFSQLENSVIFVKTAPKVGICNGDSGGPLFQTNSENRNVQMGVMSRGDSCEKHYKKSRSSRHYKDDAVDEFTDVRQYVDWICEKTGVCNQNQGLHQANYD
ncbi:trypsin [Cooperia oncophora]